MTDSSGDLEFSPFFLVECTCPQEEVKEADILLTDLQPLLTPEYKDL